MRRRWCVERAPDDDEQLVDLERLLQVVERAELHRLDRALDGRVGRHHQDLRRARPPGVDATNSRIRSRPLSSGIRLSTTRTSKKRCAEQPLRLARAARGRRPRALVAQRARQRLAGSSLRRRRAGSSRVVQSCGRLTARAAARCGPRCRARRGWRRRSCRRAPRRCSRAMARPRPVPVRRVVKYGSKTRGQVVGARCPSPRSRTVDRHALAVEPGGRPARMRRVGARVRAPRRGPRPPARVGQQVDQHDAQPLGVGPIGLRHPRVEVATCTGRPGAAGTGRPDGVGAERVEVGRRELEPDRPREVEHFVDDPVQPRDFLVDVAAARFDLIGTDRLAGAACAAPP